MGMLTPSALGGVAGRTGNPFFTTRSHGLRDGDAHYTLLLIHPTIGVQHLIFGGADRLQIGNRRLLQLRVWEDFGRVDRLRLAAFHRLQDVEYADDQTHRQNRHQHQADGELSDRKYVNVRLFETWLVLVILVHAPKPPPGGDC
ncbi:MAG: hypothetical protein WDO73_27155 [Ignavibacteriota bacterium]